MTAMDRHVAPVVHVPFSIAEDAIEIGALEILRHVRSNWNSRDIDFKLLTDGMTNKLVRCNLKASLNDVVLIRVYGRKTDLLIDRKAETRNIILLHNENLAPRLYATFENGLAYEFVPGVTLSCEMVAQPEIYLLVAAKMAKLHKVSGPGEQTGQPMIWNKLKQFHDLVPDTFTDPDKHLRYTAMNMPKERLLEEINHLKKLLSGLNSPVVFAHNDLLLGNVIYNGDENTITFIDYEYAALNYQAFDIGNHFTEFAGVDDIDYDRYPDRQTQLSWLEMYLRVYSDRASVPDEEVCLLYDQVNKFALLSHLLWGLWSYIQAEHSTIPFDFLRYASDRLSQYFARKDEFLSLSEANYP